MSTVAEHPTARTWSSPEVARISRLSYRRLDYLVRTHVLTPHVNAKGSGRRRRWDYRDLVAARAVASLRAQRVSLQAIRAVQRELRKFTGTDEDLRAGRLLIEQGRSRPNVALGLDDALVLLLRKSAGEVAMRSVFEMAPVLREVDEGIERVERERAKRRAAA